jgi:hypothetical protein
MIPSAPVDDPREQPGEAGSATPARLLVHAGLLLALVTVAAALTALYVGTENTYYFWDQAVYQNLAIRTALGFRQSFAAGMQVVRQSTLEDYNAFFALPLVPLLWAFGESRLAYELALALAYAVPLALTLGSIAALLVRGPHVVVFWTTATVTILTPMVWVPEFRGYPDVGAALLVALALRLTLADRALRRPRTILGAGALLAAAAIYRRPFLFAGPAFLAAAFVSAVVEDALPLRREPRRAVLSALGAGARVLLSAVAGLAFAFLVGRTVLLRLLAHDFYGLYTAYLMPPWQVALSYVSPYGWIACAGAVVGFVGGALTGILDRPRALFVAAFGAFTFLEWTIVVRQVGEQYTLQFTPIVILGLVSFGWMLWTKGTGGLRDLVPHAAQFYLLANALFGLADLDVAYRQVAGRSLLAASWPPLWREDHESIGILVHRVRGLVKPGEPVFVAASSATMNPDLLLNAERALYGWEAARLNVLDVPAIDSRDQYPIEALLQAQLVVLVDPVQVHLAPDEQKVVGVVHDMFLEGAVMARDFKKVPQGPWLRDGAVVSFYRRQRASTLETGLATLEYMRERVGRVPGSQPDWAVVSERYPSWTSRRADRATTLTWHPAKPGDDPKPVAVYLPDPPLEARVSGAFEFTNERCPGAAAVFASLAADGTVRDLQEVVRRPGEPGAFEASFAVPPGERLLLRLSAPAGQTSVDYCLLRVDRLVLR